MMAHNGRPPAVTGLQFMSGILGDSVNFSFAEALVSADNDEMFDPTWRTALPAIGES